MKPREGKLIAAGKRSADIVGIEYIEQKTDPSNLEQPSQPFLSKPKSCKTGCPIEFILILSVDKSAEFEDLPADNSTSGNEIVKHRVVNLQMIHRSYMQLPPVNADFTSKKS